MAVSLIVAAPSHASTLRLTRPTDTSFQPGAQDDTAAVGDTFILELWVDATDTDANGAEATLVYDGTQIQLLESAKATDSFPQASAGINSDEDHSVFGDILGNNGLASGTSTDTARYAALTFSDSTRTNTRLARFTFQVRPTAVLGKTYITFKGSNDETTAVTRAETTGRNVLTGLDTGTIQITSGNDTHAVLTLVAPLAAEYVTIFNPTTSSIDLSKYYLSDDDSNYITATTAAPFVAAGNFIANFPAGATLAAGESVTVALSSDSFQAALPGVKLDYEIDQDGSGDGVPDMTLVATNGTRNLRDTGEALILFTWDGSSDLVKDVDILVWGGGTVPNKTGKSIDGVDAGAVASTYLADSATMTIPSAPPAGQVLRRSTFITGDTAVGERKSGGNGIYGHDETSESCATSWVLSSDSAPWHRMLVAYKRGDYAASTHEAGESNVPGLRFALKGARGRADTATQIDLTSFGTADTANIDTVSLWLDADGDSAIGAADTFVGNFFATGARAWRCTTALSLPGPNGYDAMIGFAVDPVVQTGETVQFSIAVQGIRASLSDSGSFVALTNANVETLSMPVLRIDTVANVAAATGKPGDTGITVLAVRIRGNGADTLTNFGVANLGRLDDTDVDLFLWRDADGSATYTAADTLVTALSYSASRARWETTGAAIPIASGGETFIVTISFAAVAAIEGDSFLATVAANTCDAASAETGPSARLTNPNAQTLTNPPAIANHLVIAAFYADEAGTDNNGEWVLLYNPSDTPVNIQNWVLKRTSATLATFPDSTVAAHKFYLVAANQYDTAKDNAAWPTADFRPSSFASLTNTNNGISLTDSLGNIIDRVGYGTEGTFKEGNTLANPANNEIYVRKAHVLSVKIDMLAGGRDEFGGAGYDAFNNATDFETISQADSGAWVLRSGASSGETPAEKTTVVKIFDSITSSTRLQGETNVTAANFYIQGDTTTSGTLTVFRVEATDPVSDTCFKTIQLWVDKNGSKRFEAGSDSYVATLLSLGGSAWETSGISWSFDALNGETFLLVVNLQDTLVNGDTFQPRIIVRSVKASGADSGPTVARTEPGIITFSTAAPMVVTKNASIANDTVTPTQDTITVIAFRVRGSSNGDTLTRFTIDNKGILDTSDIAQVRLWRDANGDSKYSAGDTFVAVLPASGPRRWQASNLSNFVGTGADFVVTIDLGNARNLDSFLAEIPASLCNMTASDTGPANAVTEVGRITVSSALNVRIILTEVKFNGSDFAEAWILDDGNGGLGADISGWKITEYPLGSTDRKVLGDSNGDGIVDSGVWGRTGQRIVFNAASGVDEFSDGGDSIINAYDSSLVFAGTEDEVVLYDPANTPRDAVCWSDRDGIVAASAQSDILGVMQLGQWAGAAAPADTTENNCVTPRSSGGYLAGYSIQRGGVQDRDTYLDWGEAPATPGTANAIESPCVPPARVANVQLVDVPDDLGGNLKITWTADTSNSDFKEYRIYYETSPLHSLLDSFILPKTTITDSRTSSYTFATSNNSDSWYAAVTAVDSWGLEYRFGLNDTGPARSINNITGTPQLLINEVNAQGTGVTDTDYIEIFVKDDGNPTGNLNLSNWKIEWHSAGSKTIGNVTVATGDYILLTMNSVNADDADSSGDGIVNLYSSNAGLAASMGYARVKTPSDSLVDFVFYGDRTTALAATLQTAVRQAIDSGMWKGDTVNNSAVNPASLGGFAATDILARDASGSDTTNSRDDWNVTSTRTKGAVNSGVQNPLAIPDSRTVRIFRDLANDFGGSLEIGWDTITTLPDFVRYNIYLDTQPIGTRIDTSTFLPDSTVSDSSLGRTTVAGLSNGESYYIVVTVTDSWGHEKRIPLTETGPVAPAVNVTGTPKILFSEVKFAGTGAETEFIELRVIDDGNPAGGLNLSGFRVTADDTTGADILRFGSVTVEDSDFIVLWNKSGVSETDSGLDGIVNIYGEPINLPESDENLFLLHPTGDTIFDFVMWSNRDGAMTATEQSHLAYAIAKGAWANLGVVQNNARNPVEPSTGDFNDSRSITRDRNFTDNNGDTDWAIDTTPEGTPGALPQISESPFAPPAAVAGFDASDSFPDLGGNVRLVWTGAAVPDLDHYNIYRETTAFGSSLYNTNLFPRDTAAASATYKVISNLTNDTVYWFAITAVDSFGNELKRGLLVDSAIPTVDTLQPNVWYLNDNSTTGDSWTTQKGYDTASGLTPATPKRTYAALRPFLTVGDTVYVDAGTYGETVVIDTDGIFLIGKDSRATVIDPPGANSTAGLYGVFADTQVGLTIWNLGVTGAYDGVRFENVDQASLVGDSFCANGEAGVYWLAGSETNAVRGSIMEANVAAGAWIQGGSGNLAYGNIVRSNTQADVLLDATTAASITENEIVGGETGVRIVNGASGNVISKNNVTGQSVRALSNATGVAQTIPRNWWGSVDSSAIAPRVSDTASNFVPYRLGLVDTAVGDDTVAPKAPDTVAAAAIDSRSIRISWTGVTLDEEADGFATNLAGYRIYRSLIPDTSLWILRGAVGAAVTAFDDSGLSPDSTWYYRVTSFDNASPFENQSYFSDSIASATTPAVDTSGPNIWYVNDTATAGDSFTSAVGYDTNNGLTKARPKRTINAVEPFLTAGDTVYVDAGYYYESGSVSIVSNSVALIGKDSASSQAVLTSGSITASGLSGILIQDIYVIGGSRGVYFNGVTGSTITRVFADTTLSGFTNHGIYLAGGSTDNLISNCLIRGAGAAGIDIENASHRNTVLGNVITNSQGESGIAVTYNSDSVTILNNFVRANKGAGIWIDDGSSGGGSDSVVITGNTIENNNETGVMFKGRLYTHRNALVQGNIIRNNLGPGIFIDQLDSSVFAQNWIDSNGYWQILLIQGSLDTFVKNNILPGTALPDSAIIYSGANRFDFSRNWWGTTDSAAIRAKRSGSGSAKIVYYPFRLGIVDTAIGADTVAPKAPDTVAATALDSTRITVTWSPVTTSEEAETSTGLAGYRVYRAPTSDSSFWLLRGASGATSFTDSGLAAGQSFFYRVTSVDNHSPYENQSFYSDSIPGETSSQALAVMSVPPLSADQISRTGPESTVIAVSVRGAYADTIRSVALRVAGNIAATDIDTIAFYRDGNRSGRYEAGQDTFLAFVLFSSGDTYAATGLNAALAGWDSFLFTLSLEDTANFADTFIVSLETSSIQTALAGAAPAATLATPGIWTVNPAVDTTGPNIWYVNDASTTGDSFTAAVGSSANNGLRPQTPKRFLNDIEPFLTAGDTVLVDAGTFFEPDSVVINADGVFLVGVDSNATIINFNDSSVGNARSVYAQGRVGLVFRNFASVRGYRGIYWNNVDSSSITGVRVDTTGLRGIQLDGGSESATILWCRAVNNFWGFDMTDAKYGTLRNNTATGNTNDGFEIESFSDNQTATDNTATGNGNNGFYVQAGNHALTRNTATGNSGAGFIFSSSNNDSIGVNIAQNNTGSGFSISGSGDSVTGNQATGNGSRGFDLSGSTSTISGNQATGNNEGITLTGAPARLLVARNVVRNNAATGVNLISGAVDCLFALNLIDSNGSYAISIPSGTQADSFIKNDLSGRPASPDSIVLTQGLFNLDLSRNYWGRTDTSAVKRSISGVGRDSIIYTPFRLGTVDTTVGADTVAPKAPDTVTATALDSARIRVSWARVTADEEPNPFAVNLSGYRVYRSAIPDTSVWILIASLGSGIDSYTDGGMQPFTTSYYRVTSFDATSPYENQSFYSDSIAGSTTFETAPPAAFTLLAPANNTETKNFTPVFAWSAAADSSPPVSYRLIIDTDLAGTYVVDTTVTATQAIVALPANDTYLWRVIASDTAGNSRTVGDSRVLVDTATPSVPALVLPADNTETNVGTLFFSWSASTDSGAGLLEHRLQIDTLPSFPQPFIDSSTGPATSASRALPANDTYYWRVVAIDNAGNTVATAFRTLYTDTIPPTAIAANYPIAGAETNAAATAFDWTTSVDTLTGLNAYHIQIDSAGGFGGPFAVDSDVSAVSSETSIVLAEGSYFWRVLARDDARNTTAYTTATRFVVDRTAPVILAVTIASNVPGFFTDSGGIDTAYQDTVYFNNGGAGAGQIDTVTVIATGADSIVFPQNFGDGPFSDSTATYLFAYSVELGHGDTVMIVRARDTAGNEDSVLVNWTRDTIPSPVVAQVNPADSQTIGDTTPTLTWNAAVDTGAGTIFYIVQIATGPGFGTIVESATVTATNYTSAGLVDSWYYWRVVAHDSVSNADTASAVVRAFRVDSGVPSISGFRIVSSAPAYFFDDTPIVSGLTPDTVYFNPTGAGAGQIDTITVFVDDINETQVTGSSAFTVIRNADTGFNKDSYTLIYQIAANSGPATITIIASDATGFADTALLLFQSDTYAPSAPGLSAPAAGTETRATTILFAWTGSSDTLSGVAGYRIQIDTSIGFASPIVDSATGTALTATRTLAANDTYYWRVVAVDNVGNTNAAAPRLLVIDTAPPAAAVPLAPADGHETSSTTITFSWTAATDTASGIFEHRLQIDTAGTFAAPFIDSSTGQAATGTRTLYGSDTFYWRILAIDDARNTAASASRTLTIDTVPPVAAALALPADGTETSVTTVLFAWTAASDSFSGIFEHRLQVDTAGTFAAPFIDSSTGVAVSASRALPANDTYYWRVVAVDNARNTTATASRRIVVDTAPPAAVALTTPASPLDTSSITIFFAWSSSSDTGSGVRGYRLQVDTAGTFAAPYIDSFTTLTNGSRTLYANDTFSWRVVAVDDAGNTTAVASRVIHVDTAGPNAGTLSAPGDLLDTKSLTILFAWTAAYDSQTGIAYYRLQVDTSAAFAAPIVDSTTPIPSGVRTLSPNDTYWWRAIAVDSAGNTTAYASRLFRVDTVPPLAFTVIRKNGDSFVPQVTLSWNAATDTLSGLASYVVQIDTAGTFTTLKESAQTSAGTTSYLSTLLTADTYFWRVLAYDSAGNFSVSSGVTDSFVLRQPDTTPPGAFSPTAPPDLLETRATSILLRWTDAPDSSLPVTYRVQIDIGGTFAAPYFDTSGLIDTFVTGIFRANDTSTWRVIATDFYGNTTVIAPTRRVVCDTSAPAVFALSTPPSPHDTTAPTIAFVWSASADTVSGLAYYTIQIDTAVTFAVPIVDSRTGLATTATRTLTANDTYYWRVIATDDVGNTTVVGPNTLRIDTVPPTAVAMIAPAAGHDTKSTAITFAWTASSDTGTGIARYQLQVDTTTAFTAPFVDSATTLTSGTRTLPANDTYYWRVVAVDNAGNTTAVAPTVFRVDTVAPIVGTLSNPAAGLDTSSTAFSFSWTAATDTITGVLYYRLQIDTSASFASPIVDSTTPLLTGARTLAPNDTYFWRVFAVDSATNTAAYATRSLRIDTVPPQAFTLNRLSGALETGLVTLSWTPAVDTLAGLLYYNVQVDSAGTFASLRESATTVAGVTNYVSTLTAVDTYFWRVLAYDSAGNVAISSGGADSFLIIITDTTPPLAFALTAPPDLTETRATAIVLRWSDALDSSNPVRYEVQIDTATGFASPYFDTTQVLETFVVGIFRANETATWRVIAKDAAGNTTVVAATRRVVCDTSGPASFALVAPISPHDTRNTAITFTWTASTDTVSGLSGYRLQIDTSPVFAVPLVDSFTPLTTGGRSLNPNDTYYWRVLAVDDAGNTTAIGPNTLRIDTVPPVASTLIAPAAGHDTNATAIAFSWNAAADTLSGVTLYHLQIDTTTAFAAPFIDSATPLTTGSRTFPANDTYFWRVVAYDNAGNTTAYPSNRLRVDTVVPLVGVPAGPAAGLDTSSTVFSFSWTAASDTITGVLYYRLQIDTSASFAAPIVDSATPLLSGGRTLAPNDTYYWRVLAVDSATNTAAYATRRFRIDTVPPQAFTLVRKNGSIETGLVTLSWTAAVDTLAGLLYYNVQVDTAGTFAALSESATTTAGSTNYISTLTLSDTYYWRVLAYDSAGNVAISSGGADSFRIVITDTTPPAAFGATVPADLTETSATAVILRWSDALDSSNPVRYEVQIDTATGFASPYFDTTQVLETFVVGIFRANETSTWRVIAKDAAGNTTVITGTRRVVCDTSGPAVFALVAPISPHDTRNTAITFTWSASADTVSGLAGYRLQIDTSPAFAVPLVDSFTPLTTGGRSLNPNDTYYWRILAVDDAGNTTAIGPNTLRIDTVPPQAGGLSTPPNPHDTSATTIAFAWTAAVDTLSGNVTYRLQIDTANTFLAPFVDSATPFVTGTRTLPANDSYFWRVIATDNAGNTVAYASFLIRIDTAGPTAPTGNLPTDPHDTTNTSPIFRWNTSTDTGTGNVTYRLQIDTSGAFTSNVVDTTTSASQLTVKLPPNDTYFWRVIATDSAGNSTAGAARRIRIDTAPPTQVLLVKFNGDSTVPPTTLRWSPASDSVTSVRSYVVQIDTSGAFTALVESQTTLHPDTDAVLVTVKSDTYFWRVLAIDTLGNTSISATDSFVMRRTDTVPPSAFALASPSDRSNTTAVSITFRWANSFDDTSPPVRFELQIDTSGTFIASVVDTSWLIDTFVTVKLAANDTYFWRVIARDNALNTTVCNATFRLAIDTAPPSAPILAKKNGAGLASPVYLAWSSSSDSISGVAYYNIQVDNSSGFTAPLTDSVAQAPPDTDYFTAVLAPNTYFWRVYAFDSVGNAVLSAADSFVVRTPDTVPPIFLGASASPSTVSNAGATTVAMTVFAADSSYVASVLIHLSPIGRADSTPFAPNTAVPSSDSKWTLSVVFDTLVAGDTYNLVVTAIDAANNSSTTTLRVIVQDTSAPMTRIVDTPLKDLRVGGNELSIVSTYGDTYSKVLYEFRSVNPLSGWMTCTASRGLSNPDTQAPFWGFFWDISTLVTGRQYDVRAVGTDQSGMTDPSPSFVRVTIDQVDSAVDEYRDATTSLHIRRQRVTADTIAQLMIADGTTLVIPPGAVADSVWIRATEYDSAPAGVVVSGGVTTAGAGVFREFIREDGRHTFQKAITITLPYADTDLLNDKVGSTIYNEADLAIYRYDEYLKAWVKEPTSVVDPVRNTVTATVNHFTLFAVLVGEPAEANLSKAVIYPNPFVPYDNNDRNGKPYSAADPTSGIIFDSLPVQVSVEIYDAAGRRVATFSKTSNDARYAWDARTDDNRELASGVYIAVIKSSTGERAVKKIMIIR